MLATFTRPQWEAAGPTDLSDALERGEIVHFPECHIDLPSEEDLRFLRDEVAKHMTKKNISYYHAAGRLTGLGADADASERTRRILVEHRARVDAFLRRVMPDFTRDWEVGTTSIRPLQERGRDLSAHASNERVHVDAGAFGATHGDRILRFFVNYNPVEERVWVTKGAFPELYRRYGETARVAPGSRPEGSLDPGIAGRAWSGFLGGAAGLGVRMAKMIDTSPYDRVMRRFHNWMKDTPEFQDTPEGHQEFSFAPFSAWMVLTDQLSHACLSGQHALVDTFVIPLENCRLKELAPYYVLRRSPREVPAGA